jgi:hypothetical protein
MTDTEAQPAAAIRTRRWVLPVVIAAGAAVLALIVIVVLRVILANPAPPLGPTSTEDLQPGSCLAEAATDLTTYTVVDCGTPHPQQVVAEVTLTPEAVAVYSSYTSIHAYVEAICDRLIEYDLYVEAGTGRSGHDLVAIGVPDQRAWNAGDDTALCAIVAEDGADLTGSLYRPMP